jgi:tetratricopeptide (TPR) repeat protein
MIQRHPNSSARTRSKAGAAIGIAILTSSILLAGCTTSGAGMNRLERLAQRQLSRPSAQAESAEAPNGLRLPTIERASEPKAYEPLDAAIEHLATMALPMPLAGADDEQPGNAISDDVRDNALRRYIAGRSALVGDDLPEAIRQLGEASTLDPHEPEIWRALADAHWSAGDRLASIAAYLRAINLDPDDTVSLMRVGLSEMDRRSPESAAILLARAHRAMSSEHAVDPAIPHIVGVALGRTLHELGWMSAGNESIAGALDDLTSFSQPTPYRRELGATIRSAGDAWRDAGDASIRLGRPDEALDEYRRAAELPSFDPAALLTRRVYANMRLGRPAHAAMMLVARIGEQRGLVDDRTLELIGYLTRSSAIGDALAESIESVERGLTSDERRVAASQLARAGAAALPDEAGIAALIDRLIVAPSDESAVSDLLNRRSPGDAPGLVAMVSRLIDSNTIETARYAEALTRYTPDLVTLRGALDREGSITVGNRLLGAALSVELGDTGTARAMLDEASALRPDDTGVLLSRAMLAISIGDLDRGRALLGSIRIDENQAAALAVARAHRRLGDNEGAMAILDERVWSGDATAEEAQAAGETSLALGDPVNAEQLFKLAIELDPTLEDAYAGLVSLYQSTGPLASQANLGDALRALREAIPSSRTLRWLRVQDLLRADRLDQAQRELLSLAEESHDPVVVEQLVSVWLRTGAAETAQDWLGVQLGLRPNRPALVRMLARVQASRQRTDEAIATLESWLDRHPTDDAASRELENILRLERVNRLDDADVIALNRLTRSAPSTGRSIELAPILVRRNRVPEAIETLEAPMTERLRIDPSQMQSYAQLIVGVATYAAQQAQTAPETAGDGVALLGRFLEEFPDSPAAMHRTLVALLVQTRAGAETIAHAAISAGRAYPQASGDFALEATQRLIQADDLPGALSVATGAARAMPSPTPQLLAMWLALARDQLDEPSTLEALGVITRERAAVETTAAMNELLSGSIDDTRADEDRAVAELAYFAAVAFAGTDKDSSSTRLYELALEHNPRHAMANNNLAYGWVEEDINLDRAHEMLKVAFEENPGSDAIADSLGWVRYKLGMIDDQRDERGDIAFPGAVSMLTTAVKLSTNEGSPEILDHLGDALWRMSQSDRAIESWRQARLILRQLLETPNRPPAQLNQINTILAKVERKLDAVAGSEAPPLAPMLRPRRWTQEQPNTVKDDTQGAPL